MPSVILQLYALRKLMQGDQSNSKAPLGNNYRPVQLVHHRVVRTNIDFNRSSVSAEILNIFFLKDNFLHIVSTIKSMLNY